MQSGVAAGAQPTRRARLVIDDEALVRSVLLLGFALMLYLLISTGLIRAYINPAYLRFTIPAAGVLAVLGAVQMAAAIRILPAGVTMAPGRVGPSGVVYVLFAGTLLVGLLLSPVTLGADLVNRQGINLGQRARQGTVAVTAATDLRGVLEWVGSGIRSLKPGLRKRVAAGVAREGGSRGAAVGVAPVEGQGGGAAPGGTSGGGQPGAVQPPETGSPAPGIGSEPPAAEPWTPGQGGGAGIPATGRIRVDDKNFFEWVWEIWVNPEAYVGRELEMVGFVVHFEELEKDEFLIARLVVTCHVAHALPDGFIAVHASAPDLADDTWLRVVGTIETGEIDGYDVIKVRVTQMTQVPPLADPYVYPPGW